ncbi:MAG: hypothetical protein KJZ83_05515 [Burkholderiaceae bacterium]|nr:hypothetical protein [Burkholderiaceae bacterium]
MATRGWIVAAALAAVLGACGKSPERAAEKAIESAMSKDGAKAKVDLSNNSLSITTTDASGATQKMEIASAAVSAEDLGVPFYPGARAGEGQATKVVGPGASSYAIVLHSPDPVDKIASFYREQLKSASAGKQMMDMAANDSITLMLLDDKAKSTIQIIVSKGEKGSEVMITSNRATPK